MPDREWIRKTEAFLKQKFDAAGYLNAHPYAKAYRIEHTYRVANIGRQIALKEGFDETEMILACLLHDIAYCEDFEENGWVEHGRRSAYIARPFLRELGLPEDRARDILFGIAIHVDDEAGEFPGERTPFALSVADADNLDRIDAYRIQEGLSRDGFLKMDLEERTAYLERRIASLRRWEDLPMGTETAKEMWKQRFSFCIGFYEKLASQMAHSRSILD